MKQGLILCNLGTPSAPTAKGVRQFLAPFLGDQRVVELPKILWFPILYGIILPIRSKRVARAYQEIWWEGGSPLKVITERQCEKLSQNLSSANVRVAYALTYSEPSLADTIDSMRDEGIDRILILPLYPQYSATTTASIYDQVAEYVKKKRNLPALQIVRDYHDHSLYINALAQSVRENRSALDTPRHLLLSFHGIPAVNVKKGDPYQHHCETTAQKLADALGLTPDQWTLSYQSRFGKQEWLQPYTSETLKDLGAKNVAVDVICPAFAADCLETLEEISQENRDIFLEAGGQDFEYIPCLNDSDQQISLLRALVEESFLQLS
ncbi:MAG: ferrochelatase [Pseudomonadales bacterium]